LREREKGFSFRCALIFLLVIRRETRDKFRIFFSSQSRRPPAKTKEKAHREEEEEEEERGERKALFWGDKE